MALTPEEAARLAELEKKFGGEAAAPASAPGLTPEEAARLAALEAKFGAAPLTPQGPDGPLEAVKHYGGQALNVVGKGLDYVGGVTRSLVANAAENSVPVAAARAFGADIPEFAKPRDVWDALKADPKSTDQYLEKAGVPKGYQMSDALSGMYSETGDGLFTLKKDGMLDPSVRGFAGFVGDTALDPLTYLSLGTAAAAKQGVKATAKSGAKSASREAAEGLVREGGKMITRDDIYTAMARAEDALKPTAKERAVSAAKSAANKISRPIDNLSETLGKWFYKSGLKRIDQEAAKFGKEPVSDLLMERGITGSANNIYSEMDKLGEQLYRERQALLKESTKAGGEVSMREAMAPTLAKIQEIRASKNPNLQPLADALEADVQKFMQLEGRAPEAITRELPRSMVSHVEVTGITPKQQVLRELPRPMVDSVEVSKINKSGQALDELPVPAKRDPHTGALIEQPPQTVISDVPGSVEYGKNVQTQIPGLTVLDEIPGQVHYGKEVQTPIPGLTVLDELPATTGPTPLQATGYKSSISQSIPDSAFKDSNFATAAQKASKEMAGGLKDATEAAVERSVGKGNELKELNDKLGRILTSKDVQAMEAAKEANKNFFTSVDGILLPLSGKAAAVKKGADLLKTTYVRTKGGKALRDFGKNSRGMKDPLARRAFWELLNEENQTPLEEQ